ncbi:MAG: molybdopterin-dependent oxidoreductase, partial [Ferruginibacter sp.]|nr:molybdopterin-dependent oxidoreductase [Ferruginibacter sp.]
MNNPETPLQQISISNKTLTLRTILSFVLFILLAFGAWFGYQWINKQPKVASTPGPLRKMLNFNEGVSFSYFDSNKLAKEYPLSAAVKKVRVNGMDGLKDSINADTWRLQVVRFAGDTLLLTIDDIKKLPKKDIVFDFKCIEGWSQVTHWAGVPLKTFMDHYQLTSQKQLSYIGLKTPDKKYYVGIDMPSALHPQTLLCYEMNGKPLPINQGYPLRLIIPVKYGIKHLKRIGSMYFSNT